jgi:CRP-like cAMP-binding protein
MQWREFQDGEIIVSEGTASEFVYRILTGEVEIFTERTGEPIVLGSVKPVEFLGEMSVIERRPTNASARAKGPVTAEQLERWEFVQLISEQPTAAHRLIERLSERLRLANDRVVRLTAAVGDPQETTTALLSGDDDYL